ncbi:hypothetical protein GQ457_07G025250 [Hibiscus cannabinus]
MNNPTGGSGLCTVPLASSLCFCFPSKNEEFRFPHSSIRLKNRSLKVGYSGFGRFSLFGVCDCEYHSFA